MNDWITRLNGKRVSDTRVAFDTPEPTDDKSPRIAPLIHLGVLDIVGSGADKLIQGQSSAQVDLADGSFAPLACFCSAKGRMLTNAQLLRVAPDRYRLILAGELIAPLRDHLKKFAPFYKSELEVRDDLVLLGAMGAEAGPLITQELNLTPPAVWHQTGDAETQLLGHPGPQPRWLACLAQERSVEVVTRLAAHATLVGNDAWCLEDIRAGLAWLTPAHQDALLPQMINWEALGGISFKKGCYTGQEVVARAHFRGQVKKRLARAQLKGEQLPELGASVVDGEGKNRGEVIAAERASNGQIELLAVLSTKDDLGPLSVDEQAVEVLPLPYPIERLDPEELPSQES